MPTLHQVTVMSPGSNSLTGKSYSLTAIHRWLDKTFPDRIFLRREVDQKTRIFKSGSTPITIIVTV